MACSRMQGCRVLTSFPSTLFTALARCLQDNVLLDYKMP